MIEALWVWVAIVASILFFWLILYMDMNDTRKCLQYTSVTTYTTMFTSNNTFMILPITTQSCVKYEESNDKP